MVSIGSKNHRLTTQEPKEDDPLPVDDVAWVGSQVQIFDLSELIDV